MKTNNAGLAVLKKHEGCRLKAYLCPAGVLTIGFGHTGSDVYDGQRITKSEAYRLLISDLDVAEKEVSKIKGLNENQFSALVSFTYNVGVGNFKESTLRKLIIKNPHDAHIEFEFKKWTKGGGKVLPGLVTRRNDEATLYFS